MLNEIRQPTGTLTREGDTILIRGWKIQMYYGDDGACYERAESPGDGVKWLLVHGPVSDDDSNFGDD